MVLCEVQKLRVCTVQCAGRSSCIQNRSAAEQKFFRFCEYFIRDRFKCRIFVSPRSRGLSVKARLLEGYVQPLADAETIAETVEQMR